MRRNRSSQALLVVLVSVVLVFPLLEAEWSGALKVMQIVFTLVLLAGLYAASTRRRTFLIGLWLLGPAIACGWLDALLGWPGLRVTALLLDVVALAYIVSVTSAALMRAHRVSLETISAAVSIYLILGIVWAQLYQLLLVADPNCIVELPAETGARAAAVLYFSFVTLTTLGYGDILPASAAARGFVTLEAVVGQIFLTVMIARLVGMHIAAPHEDE